MLKYNVSIYWVTSRQKPELLWLAQLAESSGEVMAFRARSADNHPAAYLKGARDTIRAFQLEYNQGIHDTLVVGTKKRAGCAYPSLNASDLLATFLYERGSTAFNQKRIITLNP